MRHPRGTPWAERTPNVRPCKLGTMPALAQVHGSDVARLAPGNRVRVREAENGPWNAVYVTGVREDGYFMADR